MRELDDITLSILLEEMEDLVDPLKRHSTLGDEELSRLVFCRVNVETVIKVWELANRFVFQVDEGF